MKKLVFFPLFFLCFSFLFLQGNTSNLLKNGSFDGQPSYDGWRLEVVGASVASRANGGNPGGYVWLNHNGGFSDPAIVQTVSGLQPGQTYVLEGDFRGGDHAAMHGSHSGDPFFAIDVDGTTLATYELPNPINQWNRFSVSFKAVATRHTIRLRGEMDGRDADVALDNVSLTVKSAALATDMTFPGYYRLKTMWRGDGECLDANDPFVKTAGGAVFMNQCNSSNTQLWQIVPDADGYYRIKVAARGANQCLEGNAATSNNKNGAAFMDDCQEVTGQLWKLVPEADGYYRLKTMWRGDGECLEGNALTTGAHGGGAFMDKCQNVTGQLWKLEAASTTTSPGVTSSPAFPGNTSSPTMSPSTSSPTMSPSTSSPTMSPSTATTPTTVPAANNTIETNGQLRTGERISCADGSHYMVLQEDGNLVIYDRNHQAVWETGTKGNGIGCRLVMKKDGQLVLFSPSKKVLWNTRTSYNFDRSYSTPAWKPVRVTLENNGTLVCYSQLNNRVWTSRQLKIPVDKKNVSNELNAGQSLKEGGKLYSKDLQYFTIVQPDGNVVIYTTANDQPVWATNTGGNGKGCRLDMQSDGNLVLYNRAGKAVWSSKTHPHFNQLFTNPKRRPVRLKLKNDGMLVLQNFNGKTVWDNIKGVPKK